MGLIEEICCCCGAHVEQELQSHALIIRKCQRCNTRYATHAASFLDEDTWSGDSVTGDFLEQLKKRRTIQSALIIDRFADALRKSSVLDYGCGQGAFLSALLDAGFEALGCDLSVIGSSDDPDLERRILKIDLPWQIPHGVNAETVTLLDVLEHGESPDNVIKDFRSHGFKRFVIKVPVSNGPIYLLSNILRKLGYTTYLDKLYLVGDVAPHVVYFSKNGVIKLFEGAGYKLQSRLKIAEIGAELPFRVRGARSLSSSTSQSLLRIMGIILERMARFWSDTEVFHFELDDDLRESAND